MLGKITLAAGAALFASVLSMSPAAALTMKECSVKYKAAKADGSAKDVKWNDYRAKFCGAEAAAEDAAEDKAIAATSADKEPAAPTMKAPKGVSFPSAIDKKYASETPAKGRMKTCVDAYHVNKDAGTLNDLKWIQKGGGYWSLCSKALKKAG